ncbi:hypothetical protein KCU89_g99, partial [Aureobasidium melanogenum]
MTSASYIVLHSKGKVRVRWIGGRSFAMSTRSSHGRSDSPTDMLAVRDDGHRSHTLLSTYPSHSRQKIRAHVSSVLRKTLASLNTCHMVIKNSSLETRPLGLTFCADHIQDFIQAVYRRRMTTFPALTPEAAFSPFEPLSISSITYWNRIMT